MDDLTEGRNIVLTGVPRSGTTLTCHLLNKLPQTVALNEPMKPRELAQLSPTDICTAIGRFYEDQRRRILVDGNAASRSRDGSVPTNHRGGIDTASGKRERWINGEVMEIRKPLAPDFRLFIKHPALFTAMMENLVAFQPCFAIVRNPLAVLRSWAVADMPVSKGRLPVGETFAPALKARLDLEPDRLRRQLILLDWFFDIFARVLPQNTIKYEHVVESGGSVLSKLDPDAAVLDEPLTSRNDNPLYDRDSCEPLAEALLKTDGAYWAFYSRDDVEALFAAGLAKRPTHSKGDV